MTDQSAPQTQRISQPGPGRIAVQIPFFDPDKAVFPHTRRLKAEQFLNYKIVWDRLELSAPQGTSVKKRRFDWVFLHETRS
jgi:hypothetical protein